MRFLGRKWQKKNDGFDNDSKINGLPLGFARPSAER
jgi:hypothetical protein